jgi:hypothetical protein
VDCHLYCPVDLLCQQPLFPLKGSLIFPIADSTNFVSDRKKIITPGTVTARNFREKKLLFYGCVWTCWTDDCQLLYSNRDVIVIKITQEILLMKY